MLAICQEEQEAPGTLTQLSCRHTFHSRPLVVLQGVGVQLPAVQEALQPPLVESTVKPSHRRSLAGEEPLLENDQHRGREAAEV